MSLSLWYSYATIMIKLMFSMHINVTNIAHFWDQCVFHGVLKEFPPLKLLITFTICLAFYVPTPKCSQNFHVY